MKNPPKRRNKVRALKKSAVEGAVALDDGGAGIDVERGAETSGEGGQGQGLAVQDRAAIRECVRTRRSCH